ncbi:MAG: nuclear transport factor 2 family protein [Marmoricola sp.]
MTRPDTLNAWHDLVDAADPAGLDEMLAEDATFRSPAVHTPQQGKRATKAYLSAALAVLGPTLSYRHEWWDESSAVLEFTAEVGDKTVHGVDLIEWNAEGRITGFTVMVRPLKGLTALMEPMAEQLEQLEQQAERSRG